MKLDLLGDQVAVPPGDRLGGLVGPADHIEGVRERVDVDVIEDLGALVDHHRRAAVAGGEALDVVGGQVVQKRRAVGARHADTTPVRSVHVDGAFASRPHLGRQILLGHWLRSFLFY
ncbi:hypothetical protein D3C72_1974720 [compost metagenome]